MSELLEAIRSRGYWRFVIRPRSFDSNRIKYERLYDLVEKAAVNLGGWQMPPVDPRVQTIKGDEWIEQRIEWEAFKEIWRFYQSGQFVHFSDILGDWRDQSSWLTPDANWVSGKELSVPETLFRLTGEFELAARLSVSEVGGPEMLIGFSAYNLAGRVLTIEGAKFAPFRYPRITQMPEYEKEYEYASSELASGPRELALNAAADFFRRFDWNPPREILKKHQDDACRF